MRPLDLVAALALLVLALALRVPHGELAEWKGDEAIQYAKARAIAREGERPERGLQTTDGPRMPVHNLYVLAAPLVLRDDPDAIRLGMALLASATTVAACLVARRDLGRRAALAGALLLAVLPDLVRRGRWSWNPNVVPPLALLLVLAIARTWREPRGRAPALLLPLAALNPLLHFAPLGSAAVGVFAFLRALFRGGASPRTCALGVALAAALALPHVAREAGSGFGETRAALSVAREHRDPPLAWFDGVRDGLALDAYAKALGPSGEARALAATAGIERGASLVLLAAVLAGAGLALRKPAGRAIVVFVLGSAAPFVLLGLPARGHYVPTGIVAGLLLAGIALARAPRVLGALLLLGIGTTSVLATHGVLEAVRAGAVEPDSGYDLPYGEKLAVARLVLQEELDLVRYRRFEEKVLLEVAWRELPPERRARFFLDPQPIPYWEGRVLVPRPLAPRGRAAIVLAPGPGLIPWEVGRTEHLVVLKFD